MKHTWDTLKTRVLSWVRGTGGGRWLMIAGMVGMALIAASELLPSCTARTTTAETDAAAAYVLETEQRLCAVVSDIAGAGACRVMVTLQNGVEYVYATEHRANTDREEDDGRVSERDDTESSVIVVDTGDGREGLLVTEMQPTVRGVVVVCEGGDNERVRESIVRAVTVALDISEKQVCVTTLS